jgi:hypothetical protein
MTQPVIDTPPRTPGKAARIIGWIISILPILMMGVLPIVMLFNMATAAEGMKKYGYSENVLLPIMIIEILCTLLYAIPKTSTLGAILLTGYLGGAVSTHVRAGEFPQIALPVIFGILVWLGLLLRNRHLRQVLPFTKR